MSIIAVVDLAPIARNLLLPVLIALFVGFGSAAGVFRINSINGPSRLDLAQPVGNLLWTTVGGLTALFAATFVGQLAIIAGHRIVTHSTNDTLATPELLLIDLFSRVAVVAVILAIMARFGLNFRRMGVSSPRILPGLAKAVAGIFIVMPSMSPMPDWPIAMYPGSWACTCASTLDWSTPSMFATPWPIGFIG